ncbi:MAG: ATP-binding protein, partial [Anaerolineales bacterium]
MCGSPLAAVLSPFVPLPDLWVSPVSVEPVGEAPNLPLSGERRVATVVFADVQGSTELLEQIGTEAWVETMNDVFQILETEIYRFGGEVGQFRGDGLIAFFGTKLANEDDPERAVQCAMAMQKAVKTLATGSTKTEEKQLELRVGVNTGETIVANIGDAKYNEDTAMGEALTVAARMETAAEAGTVLVSENTYRFARNQFEWLAMGEIPAKGMSHPVQGYRPLVYKNSVEPDPDPQDCFFTLGLIGRVKEKQVLKKSIENLSAGRGGIVLVTGVRGMGKSFMVNEVRKHFMRQNVLRAAALTLEPARSSPASASAAPGPQILWLRGKSRSYSHLRPYSVWLDLLQEWLELHPDGQIVEGSAILRAQIEMLWNPDVEKDYPSLAAFLSAPVEETAAQRFKHMDAEGLKRQFFLTVRGWIRDLARRGPLVISLADLQWADSTSLELLDFCLPICDNEPVLWLLVYRLERDKAIWEFQHHVETDYPHRLVQLAMPPLTDEESAGFLDKFLGKEVFLPDTRQLVINKAEGNPYFIKELIFSLIAQGVLSLDKDQAVWKQVRPVTSLDLPDSLQGLLMARIDRLALEERRVLQMASVIGSIFWLNVFQAMAGPVLPLSQLQNVLISLQRAGLIHERAQVADLGMEYAFDSSLIREVAYESL